MQSIEENREHSGSLVWLSGYSPTYEVCQSLFDTSWERVPRLFRRAFSREETPFDLSGFEALVLSDRGGHGAISCIEEGVARPLLIDDAGERLAVCLKFYSSGGSLLFTRAQACDQRIASLCREIELALLECGLVLTEPVSANAYLTPAGCAGFPVHYDDHCSLVLQVSGRKHWDVFAPPSALPIARCTEPIDRYTLGNAVLDTDIGAGDMLYVPRGFPHEVRCTHSSSLHLTFSIRTLTWANLFQTTDEANLDYRRSTRLDLHDMPIGNNLPNDRDTKALIERRLATSLDTMAPLAADRFQALDFLSDLSINSELVHAEGTVVRVSTDAHEVQLHFPGGPLVLPLIMAPVFEFLATTKRFRASDLPEVGTYYEKLDFVRLLTMRGILAPEKMGGHDERAA